MITKKIGKVLVKHTWLVNEMMTKKLAKFEEQWIQQMAKLQQASDAPVAPVPVAHVPPLPVVQEPR